MIQLSDQEAQVVKFAAAGLTDKEIAVKLQITPATVRSYWRRLQSKTMGINRVHVVSVILNDRFNRTGP